MKPMMEIELTEEEITAWSGTSTIVLQMLTDLFGIRFVCENGKIIALEV